MCFAATLLLCVMTANSAVRASDDAFFAPYIIERPIQQPVTLTPYSARYVDSRGTASASDILRQDTRSFVPAARDIERLGVSAHPVWVKFKLHNDSNADQQIALKVRSGTHVALYSARPSGDIEQLGLEQQRFQRNPVILLELANGESATYVIRFAGKGPLFYGLELDSPQHALNRLPFTNAAYLLLSGSLSGLLLYFLIGAYLYQRYTYLFQALFMFCLSVTALSLAGFLGRLDSLILSQPYLMHSLGLMSGIAALAVAQDYLRLRQRLPIQWRLMNMLHAIYLVLLVGQLVLATHWVSYALIAMALVTVLLLIYTGTQIWLRQYPGAGLYLSTTSFVGVPVIATTLAYGGVLPTNLELPLILMALLFIQSLVLNVGLFIQQQQQQRLVLEQQRAQAVAETVGTTRRETFARLGYDIRTPLSGVLGLADILKDSALSPHQRECVTGIRTAGHSLLRIINNVMEYAQISTENPTIDQRHVDLDELITDITDLFRERADAKRVQLITYIHQSVPEVVLSDGDRLRQILTHLISAILRHSEPGEFIIDVAMDAAGKSHHVRFELRGSAITSATVEALKSRRQGHNSSELNLSIARELIQAMDGRLGKTVSKSGQYHYWFIAPLPPAPTDAYTPVDHQPLRGLRILIVDPSTTVTRILRHHTLSWGMNPSTVQDTHAALAALRTQSHLQSHYDIVLLDQQMLDASGTPLVKRIVNDELIKPKPLIVLLHSQHIDGIHDQFGLDMPLRVVVKPVSATRLRQTLIDTVEARPALVKSNLDDMPLPDNLSVLVAEDHVLSQKVIAGMLSKLGVNVDIVENGEDALTQITKAHYDLVLMDCEMPLMDGYTCAAKIRQYEAQQQRPRTPIVALTAHIMSQHQQRCFDAGMDSHIPKPLDIGVLRETLLRFTAISEPT